MLLNRRTNAPIKAQCTPRPSGCQKKGTARMLNPAYPKTSQSYTPNSTNPQLETANLQTPFPSAPSPKELLAKVLRPGLQPQASSLPQTIHSGRQPRMFRKRTLWFSQNYGYLFGGDYIVYEDLYYRSPILGNYSFRIPRTFQAGGAQSMSPYAVLPYAYRPEALHRPCTNFARDFCLRALREPYTDSALRRM